jgi:23S rRNA (guanosine2251-2'-O)-methyltransferase
MAPAGYGNRVEGLHAVAAAVAAGRVETLYVEKGRQKRPEVAEFLSLVDGRHIRVVDDVRPLAGGEAPQGLVAECIPIPPVALGSLAVEGAAILVLDHIEDPRNVGAVARSALAAGITGMVISDRRAAPLSAVAFKAAAGALEALPVAVVASIPEALNRLKKEGIWIVGLDSEGDQSLFGLSLLTEPVAIVVGAEGAGLAPLVVKRCDVVVSIPMTGAMESLNASVSGALAAFEVMRVRGS